MEPPMSRPKLSFTEHPASVGESYLEHMGVAFSFGARMIGAGLACLAHGVFPFLFTRTGSRAVAELHERMVTNRARQKASDGARGGEPQAAQRG